MAIGKRSQATKMNCHQRLRVEVLEDRVVPATRTWDNGGVTYNWSEAANWDNDIAPVSGDTVVLTGNYNTIQNIAGLELSQLQFQNSSAATLSLATPLGLNGSQADDILNGNNGNNTITGSSINLTGSLCGITVNGGALAIDSSISGNQAIVKRGFNTLTLNGANSFSSTQIAQGTLRLVGDQAGNRLRANSTVFVDPGTIFEIANTNPVPQGANAIDVDMRGGTMLITGANTTHVHIRNITFNVIDLNSGAGTIRTAAPVGSYQNSNMLVTGLIRVSTSAGTGSLFPAKIDLANGFMIENAASFDVFEITGNANPDLVVTETTVIRNGEAPGADSLVKSGTGTMALAGANTYTGGTTISAGTLQIGNAGTSGSVQGDITNNGALVFNRTGDYSVSNTISGSGTLTTLQAGTKTFTGNISLNGAITSADGRLLLNGTVGNGSSAIDLTTTGAGAIGGGGTINGATVIASGGSLFPGASFNSVGTLNVANTTLNSGSFFGVNLNGSGANDLLNVSGTINLNGANLFAIEAPTATGSITIINNDGTDAIGGTFAGLPEGATFTGNNGKRFRISYVGGTGNDVTLTSDVLQSFLIATGPGTASSYGPSAGQYAVINPQIDLIPGFGGEIRVAIADVNGDGSPDIIAGSGPGGSRVRVLNGSSGAVLADFTAFPGFGGGVYVAAGDLNGDGRAEVVVTGDGADAFSGPVANGLQVKVYSGVNLTGGTTNPPVHANFNGLASLSGAQGEGAAVRLGGRPAVADVNRDGLPDLLVSAGNGGGPRVVIWPGQAFLSASSGQPPVNPLANLFVFESTQRGGAFLTAGDINGDGFADIAVGGGPGGGPRVRTVNAQLMLGLPNLEAVNLDDPANLSNGLVLNNFFAGNGNSRGGVRVAMRDMDGDARGDLVTGSGTFEQSAIRVYSDAALSSAFGSSNEPSGPQVIDPFGAVLAGGVWIG
jgi:autotransporter-associated beta strand protein